MRKLVGIFLAAACAVPALRADRTDDVVRIHIEALGGAKRIEALAAMRATGEAVAGGKRVRFNLTAARPDRLRLETVAGGRTLVQASDGAEAPWEFDTGTWPPRYRPMAESAAKAFAADAEYDDPLVAGSARGYALEYAGEVEVGGKQMLRVNVTRRDKESYAVLLDAETYLIAMRAEKRANAAGGAVQVVTRYEDYRPVDGVLLPHRVTVSIDGRVTQQTTIDQVEANPVLTGETFTRPKTVERKE